MGRRSATFLALLFLMPLGVLAAVSKNLSMFPEGERLLYSRLVDFYRRNNLSELIRERTLLERNYPSSIYLDNAYYLSGTLQFQNARYGEAVRDFNIVTDRFPKSNKRPAALLALAMTYERLGLQPLAKRVIDSLIQDYPGSPESQRAWMHLQVGKVAQPTRIK